MVSATPTIHLNGTGRDSLMAEYTAVYNSVDKALTDLRNVTVHMRDYYVQDNSEDEFKIAQREHGERVETLENIKTDMMSLMLAIQK